MKNFPITTTVTEATYAELTEEQRRLVDLARQAATRAFAPYSHFSVGAAIALDNGETVTGSNQENAAYPSGMCAERTAAYYAHARFPEARFKVIAIAAISTEGAEVETPVSPCGACRQALLEYEVLGKEPVEIILAGRQRIYLLPSVSSTLPLSFSAFE